MSTVLIRSQKPAESNQAADSFKVVHFVFESNEGTKNDHASAILEEITDEIAENSSKQPPPWSELCMLSYYPLSRHRSPENVHADIPDKMEWQTLTRVLSSRLILLHRQGVTDHCP
jgi:hypothetical protein